ncbi:hypothetical protein AYI68_g3544 [Smittium mucronatum]|uniref:Uncharacterized protein n=1 Tax=Smittium mucronatum TaxID=133383 RepID=A0A1R0GZL2_9FUNG|nr:hypothetical protein AYI68_g3544 [Smittium mucronatum]
MSGKQIADFNEGVIKAIVIISRLVFRIICAIRFQSGQKVDLFSEYIRTNRPTASFSFNAIKTTSSSLKLMLSVPSDFFHKTE